MTDIINNVFNIEIELTNSVLTDSIEVDIENQNIIKNIYILDNINNYLLYFFILSGVVNPFTIKNSTVLFKIFISIWNILTLAFIVYGYILVIEMFQTYYNFISILDKKEIILGFMFANSFLSELIILPYTMKNIYDLLYTKINTEELQYFSIYTKAFIISVCFLVVSIFTNCFQSYEIYTYSGPENLIYIIIEILNSNILSINLFYILMNIVMSIEKLNSYIFYLNQLSSNNNNDESYILEKYKILRNEITINIQKTYISINTIIFISLISITYIVLNLYIQKYDSVYTLIASQCMFLKQFYYLVIVFYFISTINEKSSEISDILLLKVFQKSYQIDQLLTVNYSSKEPIIYKILGMVFYKKDIINQLIIYILTILFSLIKVYIDNRI